MCGAPMLEGVEEIRERWKDQKALCYALLDQICISAEGLIAEDLIDEMGIDTDEANHAVLPPSRKKPRL